MAQWGIFLRNHDELTLEMVTDEERDYMFAEYAKDPRMKANVGIRRRLALLLDNDRNQIELFTALLCRCRFAVLNYGDEIGMGDIIGSATATVFARPCSGRRTETPGFPPPHRAGCTCRRTRTPSTATSR